jgi:dolichol kinase
VSGALKAAWGLTAFVIAAGVVGWIVTGRPVFAVFVVLGVLTGAAAAFALRPAQDRSAVKEDPTS